MSLKKLDDILIKIQKYHPKYIDLNLNRINRLLQDLGNPHQFYHQQSILQELMGKAQHFQF